jgi:hypothetical protein
LASIGNRTRLIKIKKMHTFLMIGMSIYLS